MPESLSTIADRAATCTACRLSQTRTQVVFGVGDADAELMLIGEAPGFHEDQQGEPFVGAAGQLLTRLLGEIGLGREDVYIANVIKCRPPGNRDPQADEVDACKGWLRSQLDLVDPKVVLTLGNFASKLLLRTETGITRLRGHVYPWWRGKSLIATFHPAAALRNGEKMVDQMRSDFALVRSTLEAPPPIVAEQVKEPEQQALFG